MDPRVRPDPIFVPGHGPTKAVLERGSGHEAETLPGAAGVERPPWLPVRLRGVPAHLAGEAREAHHECYEVADGDLPADAEIDRVAAVVTLGGKDDAVGRVVDVQELAGRTIRFPRPR